MTCILDDLGDEAIAIDIKAEDMVAVANHNVKEFISLEPLRGLTMDVFGT
jgi:hypothetical protein